MGLQDMAAALAARDAGMQSSAEHAEDVQPGWGDLAANVASFCLGYYGQPCFTMEELRLWCSWHALPEPPDMRAWGSVTVRLIREGIIEKTGQFAPATSSHGSPKPTYRRKGTA